MKYIKLPPVKFKIKYIKLPPNFYFITFCD